MTASELKSKIATDHARLRELEQRIADGAPGQRRQFDTMLAQARKDITRLEVQLAGMSDACPACGDTMPPGFVVCRVCMSEVPFHLYAAHKGASGLAHARKANSYPPAEIAAAEAHEQHTRRAILSHLKQHGSGAGLLAA